MIARRQTQPWFLFRRGLEGRGCHISLDGCLHLPLKVTSRVEMLTPSPGGVPGTAVSTLPLGFLSRAGDTTFSSRGAHWGGAPMLPLKARVRGGGVCTPLGGASSGMGWGSVALTPLSFPICIQKVAYTTVLQEWLRLACRSDAHPELVRRHLVTFRAMSARLLDYVVNIADSNGNTALHYSVSHANFPVVRQLLDSGEPGGAGPAETLPSWSVGEATLIV